MSRNCSQPQTRGHNSLTPASDIQFTGSPMQLQLMHACTVPITRLSFLFTTVSPHFHSRIVRFLQSYVHLTSVNTIAAF